ncbi:hypothetical protein F4813DRAFT_376607 [Daldinia decipiens]|uniref:uncharacterized protein n=1 Tax=Daldinia decipiens TaxID=326647 RepID=UPI0020C333F3|nr:uncharacterized protein F4813DRAFT_376607 [Daldinia decipiens]KAI1652818.1 hypothetical protein F4813DRAFT_376607 [Daldinia decipiens]
MVFNNATLQKISPDSEIQTSLRRISKLVVEVEEHQPIMFATLARRMAGGPIPPRLRNTTTAPLAEVYNTPYKPKKIWPPDFSKLSQKEQFRFERRYKRRVKLATARPRWDKFVRLVQLFSVTSVLVYSVLFMDLQTESQPFQGLRDRFWGVLDAFSPAQRDERRTPDIAAITNSK